MSVEISSRHVDSCVPSTDPHLTQGPDQAAEVERLLGLGARHLDIGQGDVPWVVLADPEGNPFCVMEERAAYADTGPIAALPLDSGDEPDAVAAGIEERGGHELHSDWDDLPWRPVTQVKSARL